MTDELIFDSEMHVQLTSCTIPISPEEGYLLDSSLDLIPVNAARVSVAGHSDVFNDRDAGLLNRLVKDGHGTPFEHAYIGFLVEVPIFVERQWRTHRWSSFNEHSGRYSEIIPRVYVPKIWYKNSGKKMDYHRVEAEAYVGDEATWMAKTQYIAAWDRYRYLLRMEIANEEARMVLPVGFYTRFYWTANLRSIANFLSLRTDVHAQSQIREAAGKVEEIFAQQFPETYKVFCENGRKPLGA